MECLQIVQKKGSVTSVFSDIKVPFILCAAQVIINKGLKFCYKG